MYSSVDTLNKKLGYPARLVNPIRVQLIATLNNSGQSEYIYIQFNDHYEFHKKFIPTMRNELQCRTVILEDKTEADETIKMVFL